MGSSINIGILTKAYTANRRTLVKFLLGLIAAGVALVNYALLNQAVHQLETQTKASSWLHLVQFLFLFGAIYTFLLHSLGVVKKNRILGLALTVALVCLYWVPLGFDLTDEGRRLSYALYFMDSFRYHLTDFKFGSHLFAYAWMRILGINELLWMRLGFVLIKVVSALLIYKIVKPFTSSQAAFTGSFFAIMLSLSFGVQTLNYNNIPLTFVLASVYFCTRYLHLHHNWRHLVLSGVMLSIAVLCKITMLSYAGLIIAFMAVSIAQKDSISHSLKPVGLFMAGFMSIVFVYGIILFSFDSLEHFVIKVYSSIIEPIVLGNDNADAKILAQHGHDADSLHKRYQKDFDKLSGEIWKFLLVGLPLIAASWFKRDKIQAFIMLLFLAGSYYLLDYRLYIFGLISIVSILAIASIASRKHIVFTLFAVLVSLASFIGSNTGLTNMFNSAGIGLIASISLAAIGSRGSNSKSASVLFVCVISLFIWNKKESNIYRDLEPSKLTYAFESSGLIGIFSNEDRVHLIDSTLAQFRPIIASKTSPTLIAANTTPGMNFLLRASHGERLFWRRRGDLSVHKEHLNSPTIQDFIVISSFDPRHRSWPNWNKPPCDRRDCNSYNHYLNALENGLTDYRLVSANRGFQLYAHERVTL